MNYDVLILRRAQKELAGLHEPIYSKTKLAIQRLGGDPVPRGSRKLSGREVLYVLFYGIRTCNLKDMVF
jgi:mRNA-degrading endonuclease RelE of RelBE toxin-antitoxin system